MRTYNFIAFLIFFVCPFINGQTSQLDSMVNESLVAFIKERKEQFCKRTDIGVDDYFKNLYLLIDNLPRDFQFCKQLQDMQLPFFSLTNPNTKKMKKGEKYIVIFTDISLINNQLKIILSDKRVTYIKSNHLNIAISDWGEYFYEYSCDGKKWQLVDTKYGGI